MKPSPKRPKIPSRRSKSRSLARSLMKSRRCGARRLPVKKNRAVKKTGLASGRFFSRRLFQSNDFFGELAGARVAHLYEGCRIVGGEDLRRQAVDDLRQSPGGGLEHVAPMPRRFGHPNL